MKKIIFLAGLFLNLYTTVTAAATDPCSDLWQFYCSKTIELDMKSEEESARLNKLVHEIAYDYSQDVYNLIITDPRALESLKNALNDMVDESFPVACNKPGRFENHSCLRLFSQDLVMPNPYGNQTLGYATLDDLVTKKQNLMIAKLRGLAIDLSFRKKVKDVIFPRIKELLLISLKNRKLPTDQEIEFSKRIKEISYDDSDCGMEEAEYGGHYIPETNTIRLCNSFFKSSQNIYAAIQAMSHEMTHSMLPCQLNDQTKWNDKYVMKELTAKLRNEPAIGKKKKTCNTDKTMEAIPDLFAADVLTQYHKKHPQDFAGVDPIMGIATIFNYPWACDYTAAQMEKDLKDDPHPIYQWRVNRVLGANPYIRNLLRCSK